MSPTFWFVLITYTLLFTISQASSDERKVFIVYMGEVPKNEASPTSLHTNMLQQVVGSRASESLLHSYNKSFSGFVARLTEEEKLKIASMDGVVSVFLNGKKELYTTRSWDMIGFPENVERAPLESQVIIGMLDSGVWPESASFNDEGFTSPPPSKWKGSCQSKNFTCNKKIIGAKWFRIDDSVSENEDDTARDTLGHGTHTASTAAGRAVRNASLFGLGSGTARGGVPSARIAVYKVCWKHGCDDADILAAFDEAIADGVDIISISFGSPFPLDYFDDSIAIGAFHSMKNGILTSNAAGNFGPRPQSVRNFSPWSLTVAASTTDRRFVAQVQVGDNKSYEGVAVNTFDLKHQMFPIVYGGDVPNVEKGFTSAMSRYCEEGSLDTAEVNGTIVLCDGWNNGASALHSGCVGMVIRGDTFHDSATFFPLPASSVTTNDGADIYHYINSTSKPTATIMKSVGTKNTFSPSAVSFSSRGPNPVTRDILKPDLTAPGVEILAAWSEATTVTGLEGDKRIVPFNIISGTSMSCPHATAAAVYVKSFHPNWSPAAIKSALMTTASFMSLSSNSDAEFGYGSGLIDPIKAANPGLVYDAGEVDYIRFLCGQGYNHTNLKFITGDNTTCSAAGNATVWDLNYPSFALSATAATSNITRVFARTVTNVGSPVSTYKATVAAPNGLDIQVEPTTLVFNSIGEKQSFIVKVGATLGSGTTSLSGSLEWNNQVHKVRSPVIVFSLE